MNKTAKIASSKESKPKPTFRSGQQLAVIVFGGGVDHEVAIKEYEDKGFEVKRKDGYAEVWDK